MNTIDIIGWQLMRIVALLAASIFSLFLEHTHELENKATLFSYTVSMYYIYQTRKPSELPGVIQDKACLISRFVVCLLCYNVVDKVMNIFVR